MKTRGEAVSNHDEETASDERGKCWTCASKHPGKRMYHHLRFKADEIEEHLVEQYGPQYKLDGRLQKRLQFVNEVRRVWRYEHHDDGMPLSLVEVYNLVVKRLGLAPKKAPPTCGIEQSQPRADLN
jgi:hypothetical protein